MRASARPRGQDPVECCQGRLERQIAQASTVAAKAAARLTMFEAPLAELERIRGAES